MQGVCLRKSKLFRAGTAGNVFKNPPRGESILLLFFLSTVSRLAYSVKSQPRLNAKQNCINICAISVFVQAALKQSKYSIIKKSYSINQKQTHINDVASVHPVNYIVHILSESTCHCLSPIRTFALLTHSCGN